MLNIGFIACGGIARHHASRLANVRGARIVACADASAQAATSFADEFGTPDAQTYTDYRQMLRRDDVDAVWVCTPTFLHAAPVIAAAKAGKPVAEFCAEMHGANQATRFSVALLKFIIAFSTIPP